MCPLSLVRFLKQAGGSGGAAKSSCLLPKSRVSAMPNRVLPKQDKLQSARVSMLFDYPLKRAGWYDGFVQTVNSSGAPAPSQQQLICQIKFDNDDEEEVKDLEAELSVGSVLFLDVKDDSATWPRKPFGPMAPPASAEPPAQQRPAGKGKAVAGEDKPAATVNKTIQKKPVRVMTAAATKAAATKAAAAEARAGHKAMAASYLPAQDWSHVQVRMHIYMLHVHVHVLVHVHVREHWHTHCAGTTHACAGNEGLQADGAGRGQLHGSLLGLLAVLRPRRA